MAAGLVGGAGYAGHELAGMASNDPAGAEANERAALTAARADYLAAAGEGSCEAAALGAIATVSDNWYEVPKSEEDTLAALNGACPSGSAEREHEEIAATASERFLAVDVARDNYEDAIDAQEYDIEERLSGVAVGVLSVFVSYFGLLGVATLNDRIKAKRSDPMRNQRNFEHI